MSNPNITFE